ncbi:MAG: hypothetical protein M3Y33_01165 [Actinomycetota bacterium]|nr:hypothetical protein [Actinomycetota bacterium]
METELVNVPGEPSESNSSTDVSLPSSGISRPAISMAMILASTDSGVV